MSKKWYNYFVSVDPAAGEGKAPERRPRGADRRRDRPRLHGAHARIYAAGGGPYRFRPDLQAAEIRPPAHGFTIFKIADMLKSEHIRSLPVEIKRSSVLLALDAAGVKLQDVIEDAVRRDRALDTFETVQQRAAGATGAAEDRGEQEASGRGRPRPERTARQHPGQQRRSRQGARAHADLAAPEAAGRARIADAVAPFVHGKPDHDRARRHAAPSQTRHPAKSRQKEPFMFNRLSRMFRSFFGFFISVAEDPELILEQNIRDMNDQVPRMNESIAMVKANVTLLEKEEAKYKTEVNELTSKVKAAIQAGRDDLAGHFAVQLEQLRGALARTQGQLADRPRRLRQGA